MLQMPMDQLVAVETDGIYTTADPGNLQLDTGDGLGQWGIDVYDEMLYLQNGVYNKRVGDEWQAPKARGLDVASVAQPIIERYFRQCEPGEFPPLTVQMRERFVGLNAAYIRGRGNPKGILGRWEAGEREMLPGGRGKRTHIPKLCKECNDGVSAWDHSHRLAIRSRSNGEMSAPHHLPWEDGPLAPEETQKARELDEMAGDLIVRD
jgi:hypothetical protein